MNTSGHIPTMYESIPAVAELNRVPGFEPCKAAHRVLISTLQIDLCLKNSHLLRNAQGIQPDPSFRVRQAEPQLFKADRKTMRRVMRLRFLPVQIWQKGQRQTGMPVTMAVQDALAVPTACVFCPCISADCCAAAFGTIACTGRLSCAAIAGAESKAVQAGSAGVGRTVAQKSASQTAGNGKPFFAIIISADAVSRTPTGLLPTAAVKADSFLLLLEITLWWVPILFRLLQQRNKLPSLR
mgnify:CR=1 FL=1